MDVFWNSLFQYLYLDNSPSNFNFNGKILLFLSTNFIMVTLLWFFFSFFPQKCNIFFFPFDHFLITLSNQIAIKTISLLKTQDLLKIPVHIIKLQILNNITTFSDWHFTHKIIKNHYQKGITASILVRYLNMASFLKLTKILLTSSGNHWSSPNYFKVIHATMMFILMTRFSDCCCIFSTVENNI